MFARPPALRSSNIVVSLMVGLYLLAGFVHGPKDIEETISLPHVRIGRFVLAPPMVLSADSPHYLASLSSLVNDGDFDLKNNYDQARSGGLDLGSRFQNRPVDRHVDRDLDGREIGTHSPFFPFLLAIVLWPLAHSQWLEPASIWLTTAAGLATLLLFFRLVERQLRPDRKQTLRLAAFSLAFATPFLCYSRDLWTEPWLALAWLGLLLVRHPAGLAALAIAGTAIKYPFVVVPLTLGILARGRGDKKRGNTLIGASVAAVLLVVATIQYLFADVDHFSLFHSGRHVGFGPTWGFVGLLLHPEGGLLIFFPFLAWGLKRFVRLDEISTPVIAYFLLHAFYLEWHAGTGFSNRYLVPILPLLVLGVVEEAPGSRLMRFALVYSLFWGVFGGVFPALVYDRSPWEVVRHIWVNL